MYHRYCLSLVLAVLLLDMEKHPVCILHSAKRCSRTHVQRLFLHIHNTHTLTLVLGLMGHSCSLPLFSYSQIKFDNILLVINLPSDTLSFSFDANHFNISLSIVILLSMYALSTNAALHGQSIRT